MLPSALYASMAGEGEAALWAKLQMVYWRWKEVAVAVAEKPWGLVWSCSAVAVVVALLSCCCFRQPWTPQKNQWPQQTAPAASFSAAQHFLRQSRETGTISEMFCRVIRT